MKKLYPLITLVFFSLSLNAQIKKNTWLVGGQLSFNTSKTSGEIYTRQKAGAINILTGKAVSENQIVGINFGFSSHKESGNYSISSYSNEDIFFNYGVFGRQYKNLTKDLYFFGQLDVAYIAGRGKGNTTYAYGYHKSTTRGGLLALTPGLSYQIFKKLQLEITLPNLLSFQYNVKNISPTDPAIKHTKEEGWGVATSFSRNSATVGYLGVGFSFLL